MNKRLCDEISVRFSEESEDEKDDSAEDKEEEERDEEWNSTPCHEQANKTFSRKQLGSVVFRTKHV